jgi:trehalose 6-phosphate phosphatase
MTNMKTSTELLHKMLDQFWTDLAEAKQAALLLDYDGTLAPFRVKRAEAVPYPGVRERLTDIIKETATRLVIISGRSIDDLLPLLGLDPPPEIWGCHGWELLTENGRRPEIDLPPMARTGLERAGLWVAEQKLGGFSETKPASIAIHWRGLTTGQVEELRNRVMGGWQPFAIEYKLEIHHFNGGLELRCPGRDKGTAISSILASLEAGTPVAFLGDDLTDEDGFEAIRSRGLGVLVSGEPRQTHADLQINPPAELYDFLDKWHTNAPRKEDEGGGT